MNIQDYRNKLERKKGQRDQLVSSMNETKQKMEGLEKDSRNIEKAKLILQEVAKRTQQQLEYHISEIVTLALASVYEEPYEFTIDFVVRRGKTEADLYFVKNGEREEPLEASGGGVADIASFALRVAMWNLQNPKSRNTLVLDEPLKFLSRNYQVKASKMIKEISNKLGLQIVMVSHSQELIEGADKTFSLSIEKGISNVEILE